MISTTAAFITKLQEDSRTFRAQLLSGNTPINGAIKRITINKGACGESFSIGSIYSSYIEVTLDECEEILENKELLLQIGLVIDDTVEYIDMGYYTVTKPSRSAYQTTFTAVGRITSKLNCLPMLPAEQTLANLAAAITEATGVQIICKGVVLAGTIEENLTGLTCREVLEVITAVLGGFATEDNAGNIVISKFSTDDQVAFNGERTITDPEFSDYDYELTGVKVTTTEEWTDEDGTVHPEVSFTEGTPRQTLSMKYMTESLFSAFKANVVGYTYRPGTIPLALGDPRLDPWDCILYTDAKGNAHVVPCLSIVHTFDGGLSTVITAPGESESESESQVKGPLVQKMERIAYQIFTAEQAIVRRITADEADLKYATIKTLVATEAKITNLSGEFASFKTGEFETLKASVADIEKAYIDEAEVESLIADKGYITSLETNNILTQYVRTENLESEVGKFGYVKTVSLASAVFNAGFMTVLDAEMSFATIGNLDAVDAEIKALTAKAITTDNLEAKVADFDFVKTLELQALLGKFGYIKADDIKTTYATISSLNATNAKITEIDAATVKTKDLEAEVAEFGYLKANTADLKYATIKSLEATEASVKEISGNFATFKEGDFKNLQAEVAEIDAAYMDEAEVNSLVVNKGYLTEAQVDTLVAGKGYITELETNRLLTDYAKVTELNAVDSKITNLNAKAITTDNLSSKIADFGFITAAEVSADYATIKSLDAAEAQIESLSGEVGTFKTLITGQIAAIQGDIQSLNTNTVKASELESKVAEFGYAKAEDLEAESADIRKLFADYATVSQLNVTNGNIMTLSSTVAEINSAYMDEAEVESLVVGKGYLSEAQVNALVVGKGYFTEAQVNNLVAGKGYITAAETNTLLSDYVKTSTLTADYIKASDIASTYATISNLSTANAKIDGLDTKYAKIDLANVKDGSITRAMIGTGVVGTAQIADGSITDAKIVGLTANKITAGKLDAGVIEVVNLNAANITVGTINGQQIASGAIDTSKLTNSLSSTITSASTNAAQALKDAANIYEKVTSKGEQLIVNGNGMMGDNTNFSSWIFDGEVTNNSPGSFTRAAGSSGTLYSNEYFLVSTNNTYTFSFDAKSLLGTGTMYSFIMFYDVDKNTITAPNHMYHPGSTTTLAKDLKAGDTVIYLTDTSGWSTSVSYGFYLTIWNYKNSKGYIYPPESYTRNRVTLPKTSSNTLDSSKINYTANTITLASAYSGSTIPAGTSVSQGRDGGTYKYTPITGVKIPTVWTTYTGKVGGVDYSGTNKGGMFPPGVAYARIGFLWNYNKVAGEQQWITNITVTDTTAVDKAQTTADGKNTVFYQASAPSTSGRKTNDVWFDTDDSNKMYYWNGSSWAVRQFGTNAIAAASITNALIADATIQSAKIANLDAAKITTGTLSADRIAASSIVAAKIASGAITSEKIAANAVTAGKIASNAVTAGTIAADSITTEKIASGAVVADSIAANAITADKIVASAVTTDKIAANAITANKIASGTITTTQLDAAEIFANTANVGKIVATQTFSNAISTHSVVVSANTTANAAKEAAAAAQERIDNMSVGGRNLLKPTTNGGGNCAAGTNYNVTINTKSSDTYFYINLYEGLVLGEEYTLSFMISGLADGEYYNFLIQNKTTYGAAHVTNATRAHVTFTVDSVLEGLTQILIDDSTRYLTSERSITLTELKLEKGNTATDWTPAPEDTTSRITSAQTTANTANSTANSALTKANTANSVITSWCYNNNTTYIDGGTIYTGTIKAAQIDAGAITTDKIAASAVTAGKISVDTLSALSANLGTVTAGILQSENFAMSNYAVDGDGNVTGTVLKGLKIDLNNKAYYTPQITIKDNYIDLNGHMTIGTRQTGGIGTYSFAQGYCVIASGSCSHAEGADTTASAFQSHAEGRGTKAEGDYAHSEGYFTTASGDYGPHAEGGNTIASGNYSHAEGGGAKANAIGSHAEGWYTTASGDYGSHAEGRETTASGTNSHAEGIATTASGNEGSHAEGYFTTASGSEGSHAEGCWTTAEGSRSHAEGDQTTASGNYGSHAEGYLTTASGNYASHAEGWGSVATNTAAHAEGYYTTASGAYSHVEGWGSMASMQTAHAEGMYTLALSTEQHAQGKYNIGDESSIYSHIVGNGTSDTARSNSHTLDWKGNAWYAGDVIAGGTQATNGSVTGGISLKNHTHSYLPLSGGSLNQNATITLNMYGTRKLVISGNSISADMSSETGGWAGNFASVKDPSGTTTTMLGWYGSASGLTHIFMGGTYSDPALKMTGAGQFTFKSTPYVGSTLVSLANHTHSGYAASSHTHSTYLEKTTYEYNKELALGGSGAICIGKFSMYDSNITVEISSTTSTTYNGTLVIATQNYGTSGGGSFTANVYGDVSNTIAPNIYIYNVGTSGVVEIYFKPATYSKNLMHVQCQALRATPTEVLTSIDAVPSTATTKPTNLLKSALDGKANSSHTHSEYALASHSHTLDYRLQAAQSTATGSDANSATQTGFHYINGTTNRPPFSQSSNVDYRILTTAYSAAWLQQIATDFRCDDIYYRRNQSGSWQPWRRLAFIDECAAASHSHSYLPLSGGTLSGTLNLTANTVQMNFRPGHASYDGIISYQTGGNEAMVFSTMNAVTSFIFANGEATATNLSTTRWQSLTPGLQIKNNCVAIGKLIANGVTPSYTLDVGGTIYASSTIYEGGTALSSKYAPLSHSHSEYATATHYHSSIRHISTNTTIIDTYQDSDGTYFFRPPSGSTSVVLGGSSYPFARLYTKGLTVSESRIVCKPSYDNTTTYATNLYVGTTGIYSRTTNTSSRTIKHEIERLSADELKAENLYDLGVVQFKYNDGIITDTEDARYGKTLPGFIIEDMNNVYPIAVDKPGDNVKDWSWNAQYMIPPMLKLIQDQHSEDIRIESEIRSIRSELISTQNKLNAAMMKIAEQEKQIEQLMLVS